MSIGPLNPIVVPSTIYVPTERSADRIKQAFDRLYSIVWTSESNKFEIAREFFVELSESLSKEERVQFVKDIFVQFFRNSEGRNCAFEFIVASDSSGNPIFSEEERLEILKVAKPDGIALTDNFSKAFTSISPDKRMELIKVYIEVDFHGLTESIGQFKIEDPKFALEVVKAMTDKTKNMSNWYEFKHILNLLPKFKIEDSIDLYKLAINEMMEAPGPLADKMADVLKYYYICKSKNGQNPMEGIDYIFKMIQENKSKEVRDMMVTLFILGFSYEIFDTLPKEQAQKIQVDVAFRCMAISPEQTSYKFHLFKIPCEQTRLELFEKGRPLSEELIVVFNLSKKTLLSIYKTLNPAILITTMNELNFTLEESEEIKPWLLEALIAVGSDKWVRCFAIFTIVDENRRLELAQLATKHLTFGDHLHLFGIKDKRERIKLFEKYVEKHGYRAWDYYKKFNIDDDKYVAETIAKAVEKDPKITLNDVCRFDTFDYRLCGEQFLSILRMFVREVRIPHMPYEMESCYSKELEELLPNIQRCDETSVNKLLDSYSCPIIKDSKKYLHSYELITEVVFFLKVCDMLGLSDNERAKYKPFLDRIMDVKEGALRHQLLRCLLNYIVDSKDSKIPRERLTNLEALEKAFFDNTTKKAVSEFFMTLVSCFPVIAPGKNFEMAINTLKRKQIKTDDVKQRVIAKALVELINAPKVDNRKKWALFEMIFAQKEMDKVIVSCKNLTGILQFENHEILNKVDTPEKLQDALVQLFVETSKVEVRDNLKELFFKNIFTERSGLGLCLVRAAIEQAKGLDDGQRKRVNDCFKEMTEVLLYAKERDEAFRAHRFKQKSAHISAVFDNNEALKKEWANGAKEARKYEADINEGLPAERRIKMMVTNLSDANHYPASTAALNAVILKCIKDPKQIGELSALNLDLIVESLAKLFIELGKPETRTEQAAMLIKLSHLQGLLTDEYQQHLNDLEAIRKLSTVRSFKGGSFTFEDTDHPEDLLLGGTEVQGSCLAVNGINARCVLANMLDFKIRYAVVKDDKGRIIARRTIKMLRDVSTGKPVVQRERLYIAPGVPNEVIRDLDLFIGKRANALGCGLAVKNLEGAVSLGKLEAVESLDSVVPLEYSDAAGDIGGKYLISDMHLIQQASLGNKNI